MPRWVRMENDVVLEALTMAVDPATRFHPGIVWIEVESQDAGTVPESSGRDRQTPPGQKTAGDQTGVATASTSSTL